jgi:hypothetical protein
MIEKAVTYKNTDKDFISSLKKLGLSENEINFILKKYKRKKFDSGGDGGGDGDGDGGGGSSSGNSDGEGDGNDDGGGAGNSNTEGESTGDANDQGGTAGPGTAGPGPGDTMGSSTAQDTESNQQAAASNVTADNISTQAQADQEDAETAAAAAAANAANQTGIMSTVMNTINNLMSTYAKYSTIGMIGQAIGNISRGVTSPDDYSQLSESVQSTTSAQSTGNGDGVKQYAPLYNTSTGDNTADSMRIRLENLLRPPQPTTYGLPSINPYSNYTLLDLKNLRR